MSKTVAAHAAHTFQANRIWRANTAVKAIASAANITGMFHDMITEAQDQSDNMAMKAAANYLSVMKSCYGDIIMM